MVKWFHRGDVQEYNNCSTEIKRNFTWQQNKKTPLAHELEQIPIPMCRHLAQTAFWVVAIEHAWHGCNGVYSFIASFPIRLLEKSKTYHKCFFSDSSRHNHQMALKLNKY